MQFQINSSESAMTEAVETQILAHVKALEDYVPPTFESPLSFRLTAMACWKLVTGGKSIFVATLPRLAPELEPSQR